MNRNEVAKLLAIAIAAYGYMQEKDTRPLASVWAKMLGDISYADADAALVSHIASSKFFPSVAEIREGVARLNGAMNMMTADEAWNLVIGAIRRGGHYNAASEFSALPPDVQAIVGSPRDLRELGMVETSALGNEKARFRMAWESRAKRNEYLAVMPAEIRNRLEGVADKLRLGSGK